MSNIRKANLGDVEKLLPLVLESQLFQKKELENRPIDEVVFKNETFNTLKEWILHDDKNYLIVEDEHKDILGFALAMFDNSLASKEGSISDLYVKPKMRGRGIAKTLVEHSIAWLKEKGVKSINLAVHKNNLGAIELYKSVKFVPVEDNYILMKLGE
jgi:ribosomal protein S18 acetylase RimI-like enzyme